MNIFTLYAMFCLISVNLTHNGFPTQKIDYQNNQIIAASVPCFETKAPEICTIYYIKIHYEYNILWYSTYSELIILNRRGQPIYKDFKIVYDIEDGFPAYFKPIIKKIEVMNGKIDIE